MSLDIKNRQQEEQTSIIDFFKDRLSFVVSIAVGLPLILDFIGTVKFNSKILPGADHADDFKAASALVSLISGIVVFFLYSERNKLSGKNKYLYEQIGLFSIILSISLFVVFTLNYFYIPIDNISTSPNKFKSITPRFYRMEGEINKVEFPYSLSIRFFFTFLSLLSLLFSYLYLSKDYFYYRRMKRFIKKSKVDSELNTTDSIYLELYYKLRYKIYTSSKTKTSLFYLIISLLLLLYVLISSIPDLTFIPIRVAINDTHLRIVYILSYLFYYPFFILGAGIFIINAYSTFEPTHLLIQKINRLNDDFWLNVKDIVDELDSFQTYHNEQLAKNKRRRKGLIELIEKNRLVENRDRSNSNDYEKRLLTQVKNRDNSLDFMHNTIVRSLNYFTRNVNQISSAEQIVVAGKLIDEIISILPYKLHFEAVSWNDLDFWKNRGQEYLLWNDAILQGGGHVTRIFIIEHPKDVVDYEDVFIDQINRGIEIAIMSKKQYHEFISSEIDQTDFGMYDDYATSFFEKMDVVGGRTFRIEFDYQIIQSFRERFNLITRAIAKIIDLKNQQPTNKKTTGFYCGLIKYYLKTEEKKDIKDLKNIDNELRVKLKDTDYSQTSTVRTILLDDFKSFANSFKSHKGEATSENEA